MKKITLIAVALLMALFFASCATVKPNSPAAGPTIPITPMKVKKMTPVTYQYESANIGCSEIGFLNKFVGKKIKLEDGSVMFVDNILDIQTEKYSSQRFFDIGLLGLLPSFALTDEKYNCNFWGLAVEYEK